MSACTLLGEQDAQRPTQQQGTSSAPYGGPDRYDCSCDAVSGFPIELITRSCKPLLMTAVSPE
jgi:hypothetical protein